MSKESSQTLIILPWSHRIYFLSIDFSLCHGILTDKNNKEWWTSIPGVAYRKLCALALWIPELS